jgi:hypothetical protein
MSQEDVNSDAFTHALHDCIKFAITGQICINDGAAAGGGSGSGGSAGAGASASSGSASSAGDKGDKAEVGKAEKAEKAEGDVVTVVTPKKSASATTVRILKTWSAVRKHVQLELAKACFCSCLVAFPSG